MNEARRVCATFPVSIEGFWMLILTRKVGAWPDEGAS